MTIATARLSLPLIVPGQAQKELAHNEALTLLDMAVHATVQGAPGNVPPDAPATGQCWIVGAQPTGQWSGHAHALAGWTEGGWRFVPARIGMTAWDEDGQDVRRFAGGGGWIGVETVDLPNGGATVDIEARATLAQLAQALRQHGLLG